MKYIIANDIRIIDPTIAVYNYCDNFLTIPNPDYIIAEKLGRNVKYLERNLKLYARMGNELILPFGTLKDIWTLNRDGEYELKFHRFHGNNIQGAVKLYDYQERALNALKSDKNGVLQAPCGSGKTQIGLQLIKAIGGRALWLTHTKKLLTQSKERAESLFIKGDYGTITEGQVNIGSDITFATIQTMAKIDPAIYRDAFDIVVVDECHHAVGSPTKVKQFYKVITNCNARYKYGLSATLSRADGLIRSLFAIIGDIIHTITELEVGEKIIKAKHIKVDVPLTYSMRDYCDADGTLNYAKMITMLGQNEQRNQIIIDQALAFQANGKKQMILCSRLDQIDTLATALNAQKIIGTMKEKDRNYKSDIIVATFALAREGLDIPDLDVLHLATPQKNKAIVKQSAGRVERNIAGKGQPIIIDYVDTTIGYCLNAYTKRKNILKK